MNLPKLTDDLNIISSLANRPPQAPDELKKEFDKAGNIIKNFLNDIFIGTLETEVDSEIEGKVQSAVNLVNKTIEDLEKSVQQSIGALNEEINQTILELKEEIKTTTLNYTGFEITSNSINYNLSQGQSISSTQTTNKEGYLPLGIVGHNNTNISCDIRKSYLSTRDTGKAVTTYFIQNEDYGNPRSGTYTYYILWVKVS